MSKIKHPLNPCYRNGGIFSKKHYIATLLKTKVAALHENKMKTGL